jgi:hypothetical protein
MRFAAVLGVLFAASAARASPGGGPPHGEPGETLRGVVVDDGGAPAAGAEIALRVPGADTQRHGRCAADGTFAVHGLPRLPCDVRVTLRGAGGAARLAMLRRGVLPGAKEVRLVASPLPPPNRVVLRIVDDEGRPVGARCALRNAALPSRDARLIRAETAGDGRVFWDMPREPEYVAHVDPFGFAPRRVVGLRCGGAEETVVVAPAQTLRGQVAGAKGDPVAGAVVLVYGELLDFRLAASTDAEGAFAVNGCNGEPFDLVAIRRGDERVGLPKLVTMRRVRVADGPVTVVLGCGLTISGTVEPARRVGVKAIPVGAQESGGPAYGEFPAAWTDEKGAFAIEGLAPGRYRLKRWFGDGGSGYSGPGPATLEGGDSVAAGTSGVRLTLSR